MIRAYRGVLPRIAASAYVDPSAQVIGDVKSGNVPASGRTPCLRGDVNAIRIGEETNIQDNSRAPRRRGRVPVVIGNRVTVGHSAVLHGCRSRTIA